MRTARWMTTAIATATLGLVVTTGAAQAQPSGGHGALASYQGKTIDLSKGWQGAHTCAVFAQDDIRCYSTAAAGEKASGYKRATDTVALNTAEVGAAAVPACARGWVCLYEHNDGGGKRLIFQDGDWQNLDDYSFDNKTSSWRNNQYAADDGDLAEDEDGGGWTLELDVRGYASSMGGKNDEASSVRG
ncbi:peptidase inhibitor family I36 protein [Streptomyces sp. NPDC002838]|uniref:peptidase inhibitor family I36 protein n=1 Tax=Streptomyces sp. NPDC002838 TaxID=3154436 RepID=UPI0033190A2E